MKFNKLLITMKNELAELQKVKTKYTEGKKYSLKDISTTCLKLSLMRI
jgi:hypothetical protein